MNSRKQVEKRVKRTVHIPQRLNDWLNEESGRSGISGNDFVIQGLELVRQQRNALSAVPLTTAPAAQPDPVPLPTNDEEYGKFD
jgi:hypothetical protein